MNLSLNLLEVNVKLKQKIMRKTLQSIGLALGIAVSTAAFGQVPNNNVYPGGLMLEAYTPTTATASYTPGVIHDIDAILDGGQAVLLDLFAVWCSPCWNYHNNAILDDVYNSVGAGGSGDVMIFGVEADPSTAAATLEGGGSSIGDWITGTHYPMVNHDGIASMMNLAYYPTLILICPDRTVTEVGQITEAGHIAAIAACGGIATAPHDPRIIANNSDESAIACGPTNPSVDITVVIQNYSTAPINGSYDLEVYDNGNNLVVSTTTTLSLAPYAATEVTVGAVSPSIGNNAYTVKIATGNDNIANDEISASVNVIGAQEMDIHNGLVSINVAIDAYASEFGMVFDAGVPPSDNLVQIHNDAFNNVTTPIGFSAVGAIANGTPNFSASFPVAGNEGCHYFMFVDSYGDGINYQTSGKGATITTAAGGFSFVDGSWGDGTFKVIEFRNVLSVDEDNLAASFSVYPNPAQDFTNLALNVNETSNVTIQVVNVAGQVVYTNNLGQVSGQNNIEISTADLEGGIYFVNLNVNGDVITERISVIK